MQDFPFVPQGLVFFSHDIGGFEATATPDVYKRWCAFGLMSTHSRLHGSSSYRVPWLFDEEACDVLAFYTRLKGSLMPYLYSQAVKTSQTGIPMMRALIIEFDKDPACKYIDSEYMLGDSLLVAPVMNSQGTVDFYVPHGNWTDIVTKETYVGGCYYHRQCNYTQMPILAREDTIIGYGNFKDNVVYDYVEDVLFIVYSLQKEASTIVYNTEGQEVLSLSIKRSSDSIDILVSSTIQMFKIDIQNLDLSVSSKDFVENQLSIQLS